jgi:hypothetical protein
MTPLMPAGFRLRGETMFKFTIRELVLLTLVAAMGVAWWLDRNKLFKSATDAAAKAAEIELERATWELRTQHEAVAHNKTLRVIEQSGLGIMSNKSKSWLVQVREPDPGFSIEVRRSATNRRP